MAGTLRSLREVPPSSPTRGDPLARLTGRLTPTASSQPADDRVVQYHLLTQVTPGVPQLDPVPAVSTGVEPGRNLVHAYLRRPSRTWVGTGLAAWGVAGGPVRHHSPSTSTSAPGSKSSVGGASTRCPAPETGPGSSHVPRSCPMPSRNPRTSAATAMRIVVNHSQMGCGGVILKGLTGTRRTRGARWLVDGLGGVMGWPLPGGTFTAWIRPVTSGSGAPIGGRVSCS